MRALHFIARIFRALGSHLNWMGQQEALAAARRYEQCAEKHRRLARIGCGPL